MKNFMYVLFLSTLMLPACAEDIAKPSSVTPEATTMSREAKFYSMPNDSRFQYDLPNFKDRGNSVKNTTSSEEITLDPQTVKPVKKVIKTLNSSQASGNKTEPARSDMPMTYESFPRFYDANDMLQQQPIMPMF